MTDANTTAGRMVAACTNGDEATARELLGEMPSLASHVPGAPLEPLHYAVREGHAGIVRLLLEHGADPHVVVGRTVWGLPLRTVDVAAARGFGEVVTRDGAVPRIRRLTSTGPRDRRRRDGGSRADRSSSAASGRGRGEDLEAAACAALAVGRRSHRDEPGGGESASPVARWRAAFARGAIARHQCRAYDRCAARPVNGARKKAEPRAAAAP